MTSRRHFLFGSLAAPVSLRAASPRRILVMLVDGFGPDYLNASEMPNLRRIMAGGFARTGRGVIPSVTNVNNASVVTRSYPEEHGITSNFFRNPETGRDQEMESREFLLKPTILETARARGWKTAIVSAKDKVRSLCGRGAQREVSAEKPTAADLAMAGPAPNLYAPEANYWILRAARHLLKNEDYRFVYLSTTDYMMHTYGPREEPSLQHLHTVDKLLGEIVHDHPALEFVLTADHGMNAKRTAIDLARVLKGKGVNAEAIPIIKDKHRVHHQNLGGAAYVFLERVQEAGRAMDVLRATAGVEEVYPAREAARQFRLHPQRIGHLFVLAARDAAFGALDAAREDTKVRTHGSRHEAEVPLIGSMRVPAARQPEANVDLTRLLSLVT